MPKTTPIGLSWLLKPRPHKAEKPDFSARLYADRDYPDPLIDTVSHESKNIKFN